MGTTLPSRLKGMPTPSKILVLVLIVAFTQGQPLDLVTDENDYGNLFFPCMRISSSKFACLTFTVIPERLIRSNFLRFGKRDDAAANTVNTDNGMDEVTDNMTISNKVHKSSPRSFLRFGKRRSDNFLRFGKRGNNDEEEGEEEPCSPLGHFFMICRLDVGGSRYKKARDFLRFGKK